MISRFLRADCVKKYPLSSLKVIFFGGAAMKAKTQENMRRILPHVHMLQGYGKCLFNVIKYYKYAIKILNDIEIIMRNSIAFI